jgi:hypothetical protein
MAQPTNAITAEYLRQLHARRAPAGSPWAVAAAIRAGAADRPYRVGATPHARLLPGLDRDGYPIRAHRERLGAV